MRKLSKIEDYKNNDELNLEKVIDEYSGYVYKIIANMTHNNLSEEDIQEIVSDTFFILWKNKDKLYDDKLLSSYIAGITRNLVKEKLRDLNYNSSILDYTNDIEDNYRVDVVFEKREEMCLIEKSLKQMKQEDIEIFELFYYQARKVKEISKIMDISVFSVKTKLHRIRNKIKKDLRKGDYRDEE